MFIFRLLESIREVKRLKLMESKFEFKYGIQQDKNDIIQFQQGKFNYISLDITRMLMEFCLYTISQTKVWLVYLKIADSFTKVKDWITNIHEYASQGIPVTLIGNKIDLEK